jgi:hypothetical protein
MSEPDSDLVVAIADLVQRTGGKSFEVRYSRERSPVVWMAVAVYRGGLVEVDAAITPEEAAWRLGERLVDGGECAHCARPTVLCRPDEDGIMPGACQYTLRGERVVRGCE